MAVRPANRTERDKHTGLSVFSPLLALSVRPKCHKHCLIKGLGAKSNANCQDKKHPIHRDCAAQRGLGGRCLPGGHYMPLNSCCTDPSLSRHRLRPLAASALLLGALASGSVWAQNYPITEGQRSRATQVAEAGVPLSELAPNAPSSYKVKRGDTLWAISGLFLKSPWRWPELWGMNLDDIKNPHLIYPGQELFLDTSNGRARLTTRRPDGAPTEVRVSPTGSLGKPVRLGHSRHFHAGHRGLPGRAHDRGRGDLLACAPHRGHAGKPRAAQRGRPRLCPLPLRLQDRRRRRAPQHRQRPAAPVPRVPQCRATERPHHGRSAGL